MANSLTLKHEGHVMITSAHEELLRATVALQVGLLDHANAESAWERRRHLKALRECANHISQAIASVQAEDRRATAEK